MANFFDKAVKVLAPGLALKRELNRKRLDKLSKRHGFEGAKHGRGDDDYNSGLSASNNLDVANALPMLRNRSKYLWKNNPYINNAIKRIANNVVGSGILPFPKSGRGPAVKSIKDAWSIWGETTACDFYGKQNFYGLQKTVMKTVAKTGNCFVRVIRTPWAKGQINIQLQLIDADLFDRSKNQQTYNTEEGYIQYGIEYDRYGREVAYWLYERNPFEFARTNSIRVPASEIIHVFQVDDPGQTLGVPFVTPVIKRTKDLDSYEDAQLVKQQTSACFAGFIEDDTGGDGSSENSTIAGLNELQPGRIERLDPGTKITFATPPDAGTSYDPYVQNILRSIAAGMGISYEALTNDYSKVNFSSGRMGWMEFQRNIEEWQWQMMVPMFCEKVWTVFIDAAALALYVPYGEKVAVTWTTPRREMIDPEKETKALSEQCRNGFISWFEAVKSMGYNPDEVLEELRQCKDLFDKLGLKPLSDARFDSNRPAETVVDEEEKEADQ